MLGVDLFDCFVDYQYGGLSVFCGGDVDFGDGVVSFGECCGVCCGVCVGVVGVGDGYVGNCIGSIICISFGYVVDLCVVGEGIDVDVGVVDCSGDFGSCLFGGFVVFYVDFDVYGVVVGDVDCDVDGV